MGKRNFVSFNIGRVKAKTAKVRYKDVPLKYRCQIAFNCDFFILKSSRTQTFKNAVNDILKPTACRQKIFSAKDETP